MAAPRSRKILIFMIIIATLHGCACNRKKPAVITDISDHKDFKKLMKEKSNVLVLFLNDTMREGSVQIIKYVPGAEKQKKVIDITEAVKIVRDAAEAVRGVATLCIIDCTISKKLCKRLKIPAGETFYIKHYRNGEFHKYYDRALTVSAMTNFLRDPTGDIPWDEDPTASDVYHLTNAAALNKFLKKTAAKVKRCLIVFYAPWCGYCKMLKPDFSALATEFKGEALFAAIDVSKHDNSKIRLQYNVTGFPTILYFEKGVYKFTYNGEHSKAAILEFMKDPKPQEKKLSEDEGWSDNSDIVHLTAENFESTLENVEHALVVFYAPWCGHCKNIKPELEKAAATLKNEKFQGIIAAVDATKQISLADKFGIKGYPTLKYFHKGQYQFDAALSRKEYEIVNFLKKPQEAPPPPPLEEAWSEQETAVRHLKEFQFKSTLKRIKHALVMFYAPWCAHCKNSKPEFIKAAEAFADQMLVSFCAVDCTTEKNLCASYDVKGYPTFKYFSHFDKVVEDYKGGRKAADFISFIHTQSGNTLGVMQTGAQAETSSGFGVDVQIATDKDFETVIARPKPTLVMFYASWCTGCMAAKPIFSKVATSLSKGQSSVIAVAIDAAQNPIVADFAQINNIPVFKLYLSGNLIAEFDGQRTEEALLQFCAKYDKVKDEL